MKKENTLEKKAGVEQNLIRIEKDIKNLKEFFLVIIPILSKGGVKDEENIKNN